MPKGSMRLTGPESTTKPEFNATQRPTRCSLPDAASTTGKLHPDYCHQELTGALGGTIGATKPEED